MSRKLKWTIFFSMVLPLLLITGYQLKENYTTTTNDLPLYRPSDTTVTDRIVPTTYRTPLFQNNEQQMKKNEPSAAPHLLIPHFPVSVQTKTANGINQCTIQVKSQHKVVTTEVTVNTQNPVHFTSSCTKHSVWRSLNPFRATTRLDWKQKSKKRMKAESKKKKPPATMYSLMNENTPDIELNLGYTK